MSCTPYICHGSVMKNAAIPTVGDATDSNNSSGVLQGTSQQQRGLLGGNLCGSDPLIRVSITHKLSLLYRYAPCIGSSVLSQETTSLLNCLINP